MASIFAKRLIGETTSTGDIAPVEVGAPLLSNPDATAARRKLPTAPDLERRKKLRNRVVDGIMGRLKEDRDGAVIPNDAKEVKSVDMNDHGLDIKEPNIPGQKIKNPYSGEEPLILPAASLVAPDVTPEAIHPLDPTQLPGADRGRKPESTPSAPMTAAPAAHGDTPVVDLLLGKTPGPAQSGIAGTNPSQPGQPPGSGSPVMSAESALSHLPGILSPAAAVAAEAPRVSGQAALAANQPMPTHVPGDGGKTILEAFSRFVPRGSMK